MVTPKNIGRSAGTGQTLYAGRTEPKPAWWYNASVGTWYAVPNTANPPGGLNTNAFGDMTLRPSDSAILVAAAGGHSNGNSNAAAQLVLDADTPSWQLLKNSTWNGTDIDVLYYSDNTPTSRHTYHHSHYIQSLDAILLGGCRFGWGGGTPTGPGMDLFQMGSVNNWLPRNTWPDILNWGSGAGYVVVQDGIGNLWTQSGYKFTVATGTWSKPGTGTLARYPATYDSALNRIFALQYNDGEGFGQAGLVARYLDPVTGNGGDITFSPASGAVVNQFIADNPVYAGMAYNPVDGKHYFMHPNRMGKFYRITPNAGTVWDMDYYVPNNSAIPPNGDRVLCKRLLWVPKLQGFILQSDHLQDMRFLRMV